MLRKLRLQTKIVLMFSAVVIAIMSIAIIFDTYSFNNTVKNTYVSQLKGITTTINGRYEESRSIENVQQIFDYIKHRERNVIKINLHVKKGNQNAKILASTNRKLIGNRTPKILFPTVDTGKTMFSHSKNGEQHVIRVVAPLLEDGMTIGAIELFLDSTKEAALIEKRVWAITIGGITFAIILIAILWIIIRHLLVLPLMKLREAAASIERGEEYEEIPLNASHEVNQVATAFNEMVDKLEDRYHKSITDPLTGIYNSAYFKQKLVETMENAKQTDRSMALLFCDVDNFKSLNDHRGHTYGDEVLIKISQLIINNVRPNDIVCRYGGEEFVVIMPEVDMYEAKAVAEKIRHVVAIKNTDSSLTPLTISIGIALYPDNSDEESIIHIADQAMYTAKNLGKNRVILAGELHSIEKQNYSRKTKDQRSNLNMVVSLTKAVEAKDSYTHSHSEMVSKYAAAIASSMGLSDKDVKRISIAGLLHDVGKIGIPDYILNKEGRLTNEEYELMKTHPELGYNILASVEELKDTIPYVLHHHERYDGKGYPFGLKQSEIPLGARIIAVADAFHSMTSARPYRKVPLTTDKAIEQLEDGKGTQFDDLVVEHFLSIIEDIIEKESPKQII
jgi:diguanylate cyclase (GGDEF)-like protein/putative nucleotidyltransferase with HDIG domain